MTRTFSARNRQLKGFVEALRRSSHEAASLINVSRSGIRRSRTLAGQDIYPDFGHVQPASALRRVADLESSGEARHRLRLEPVAARRQAARVQADHHQHDPFAGKAGVGEVLQHSGEVLPRVAAGDVELAPSDGRGTEHEQVRRSAAPALEVKHDRPVPAPRQR